MNKSNNNSKTLRLGRNRRRSAVVSLTLLVLSASLALAAPPWSPAIVLSKAAINAESPAVAVNDAGMMAAIWARQQGVSFVVEASLNLTGTWSKATALTARGQSGFEPAIAIDGNGVATAVWSSGTTVMSSTLLANGKWSRPIAVSSAGTPVGMTQVVTDPAGNVTAMWLRYSTGGVASLEAADRPASGNWLAPVTLAPVAPQDFQLVVNAAGDMAVVWDVGSFVSSDTVYSSDRHFAGTWSAPYILAPAAYRQGGGRIGIDAAGNLTACWRTNTVVNTADKLAGGSWGATQVLYTSSSLSAYPTLAKTPAGDVMAAWITYIFTGGGYNYQIRTSTRPAGGSWSAAQILTSNQEYDLDLHAGATPGGTFVLSWIDANTIKFEGATRTATTPWSVATIASANNFGTNLAVADNTAVAIWLGGSFQATVSTLTINP